MNNRLPFDTQMRVSKIIGIPMEDLPIKVNNLLADLIPLIVSQTENPAEALVILAGAMHCLIKISSPVPETGTEAKKLIDLAALVIDNTEGGDDLMTIINSRGGTMPILKKI